VAVWFVARSCAFLMSSELAGVLVASSAEPLGAVSSCGEARHQLVRTTRMSRATVRSGRNTSACKDGHRIKKLGDRLHSSWRENSHNSQPRRSFTNRR
jgi:hypothetical protein